MCAEGNSYRFDHAKSREALYDEIPLPLKQGYHGRIAERIEKANTEGKLPLADLAYHYAQAGNSEKALKYAIEAGMDAYEKFSNAQAISHFTYALKAVEQDPKRTRERTIALEGLGDAYEASSMFLDALKTFEQLSNIATGVLKLRALRKALHAAWHQGNSDLGTELAAKAEEYITLDRLEAGRIYLQKAALYGLKGQIAPTRENNQKALQIFEEEYSLPDVAQTLARGRFSISPTRGNRKRIDCWIAFHCVFR